MPSTASSKRHTLTVSFGLCGRHVQMGEQCHTRTVHQDCRAGRELAGQLPADRAFIDVPITDPFYCYIETAYSRNIISGYSDGTFRPGNNATRGQITAIIYRVLTGGAFPTYTPLVDTPTPVGSGTAVPTPTFTPVRFPTMTPIPPSNISISDFSFTPDWALLPLGGTFTWHNNGPSVHTVTSDTGAFDSGQSPPAAPSRSHRA